VDKRIVGIVTVTAGSLVAGSYLFKKFHYGDDGFNSFGYDIYGYDMNGYDRYGYDMNKMDRSSLSFEFYANQYLEMKGLLNKAYQQIKKEEFDYALRDIRIGLEKGIKCVIYHWKGKSYLQDSLDKNITFCKCFNLLAIDFIKKLYNVKNYCNLSQHDTNHDINAEKEYNQIYSAYGVLEEFMSIVKQFTNGRTY